MKTSHSPAQQTRRHFLQKLGILGASSGLAGLLTSCADEATDPGEGPLAGANPFLDVRATVAGTGMTLSLAAKFDPTVNPARATTNLELCGSLHRLTGPPEQICLTIARSLANALTIEETAENSYRVLANGRAAPYSSPFEIRVESKRSSASSLETVTGRAVDPRTGTRLDFTLVYGGTTVAAIWPAAIAAAILLAIAACLALAIAQAVLDACAESAINACKNSGGVRSVTVVRNPVVTLNGEEGFTLHCGEDCRFVCNNGDHNQGAGG